MENKRGKVNYQKFHLDPAVRKTGKEDKHAVYNSDFGLACSFCGKQKLSEGFALGIPEATDVFDMLVSILADKILTNIGVMRKMYSYLSEEFIHFSTNNNPDAAPREHDFEGKKARIWSLDGVLFSIELLIPIMTFYFEKLEEMKKKGAISY